MNFLKTCKNLQIKSEKTLELQICFRENVNYSNLVGIISIVKVKDYKLRGLDTRQRRPQKWRYKPNYSILTRVFLDLPQLLQSSTDRVEYRQTKHINQCSGHTFQSVFIDYPSPPHIRTGSDFSQLWNVIILVLSHSIKLN